jgi:hypothetical protein
MPAPHRRQGPDVCLPPATTSQGEDNRDQWPVRLTRRMQEPPRPRVLGRGRPRTVPDHGLNREGSSSGHGRLRGLPGQGQGDTEDRTKNR